MSGPNPIAVLFLDIDGTVRQSKDDALGRLVNGPKDVIVFPRAVDRMRQWRARGGLVVGVSNQGGIALGLVSKGRVAEAMAETERQAEGLFELIWWCPHHPKAANRAMARCSCRKPAPGAITEAVRALEHHRRSQGHGPESYPLSLGLMVGDRPEDRACAEAAGLRFQWAADWREGASTDDPPS